MLYICDIQKYQDKNEIEFVKIFNQTLAFGVWKRKEDVIKYIKENPYETVKTKYFKYGYWHEGEIVRVVDNRYLRTDSNNIKADNLGEL